jgi:hypothetical protein
MRKPHQLFSCDICGNRFPVAADAAADPVREILCPRCRTPFVRPVARRRGSDRNGTLTGPEVSRCMAFS